MNQKNSLGLDSCFMDFDDPLELFRVWMSDAEKKEINDPNALSLATANDKKQPSVRMILLKGYSHEGFIFYTNLNSPKSKDLKINPQAAMCFHWKSLERQVRILGNITPVSDNEANDYFDSRPYKSKISAWASDQSRVMTEKNDLIKNIENFESKHPDKEKVPRPKHWSGWCLKPISIEFWLGHEFRIHERLKYKKISNKWEKEILYP